MRPAVPWNRMMADLLSRPLFRESTWYFACKAVSGICLLGTVKLYSIFFTVHDVGLYSLVASAAVLWFSVWHYWISAGVLRFENQWRLRGREREFLSSLTRITLWALSLGTATGFFALLAARRLLLPDVYRLALVALLSLAPTGALSILQNWFRARRMARQYAVTGMASALLKLLLLAALPLGFGFGISSVFLSVALGEGVVLLVAAARFGIRPGPDGVAAGLLGDLRRYGSPLVTLIVLDWLLNMSDRYLIQHFFSSSEVGLYSIAYTLGDQATQAVSGVMMLAFYPALLQVWNVSGREETERFLTRALGRYFVICVPMLAVAALLRREIILVCAAPKYLPAADVLPWVVFAGMCLGISQYVNKIWELYKRTAVLVRLSALAMASNVLLNLFLLPRYGYRIAAMTTAASYVIYILASAFFSGGRFRIPVLTVDNLIAACFGLAAFPPTRALRDALASRHPLLALTVSTAFYLAIYFALIFMWGPRRLIGTLARPPVTPPAVVEGGRP